MNLFAIVVNGKNRDIFRLRLNQELQMILRKALRSKARYFWID
jgi:hypothetical protein